MDHLEHPSLEQWESRRKWFEDLIEEIQGQGSYLLSEQACALLAEVQSVFCAGAWAAVKILAMTVVDAQLRETEIPGFKGNTKKLLDAAGANPELQKLRKDRNALVHLKENSPALTVDQQWLNREEMEVEARHAVKIMLEAFFIGPWI